VIFAYKLVPDFSSRCNYRAESRYLHVFKLLCGQRHTQTYIPNDNKDTHTDIIYLNTIKTHTQTYIPNDNKDTHTDIIYLYKMTHICMCSNMKNNKNFTQTQSA